MRPLAGWQQLTFAQNWPRPPRHMTGTPYFYLHTGQWRYEQFGPAERASLLGSSGKGMEYFMRHLLGTHDAVRAEESPESLRSLPPGRWSQPRSSAAFAVS